MDRCFSLFLKGVDANNDNSTVAQTAAESKTTSLDNEKEIPTTVNIGEDVSTVGDVDDDTNAVNSAPQSTGNADEDTYDNLSVCVCE